MSFAFEYVMRHIGICMRSIGDSIKKKRSERVWVFMDINNSFVRFQELFYFMENGSL